MEEFQEKVQKFVEMAEKAEESFKKWKNEIENKFHIDITKISPYKSPDRHEGNLPESEKNVIEKPKKAIEEKIEKKMEGFEIKESINIKETNEEKIVQNIFTEQYNEEKIVANNENTGPRAIESILMSKQQDVENSDKINIIEKKEDPRTISLKMQQSYAIIKYNPEPIHQVSSFEEQQKILQSEVIENNKVEEKKIIEESKGNEEGENKINEMLRDLEKLNEGQKIDEKNYSENINNLEESVKKIEEDIYDINKNK